jgi:hypothetical protein
MSVVNKWDPTHFIVLFAPVGVGRKSISTVREEVFCVISRGKYI